MTRFEHVQSLLPTGSLSLAEWNDPAAQWLHEMPWEEARAELDRFRESDPVTADTIGWLLHEVGKVEDRTPYYSLFLSSVRGIEDNLQKLVFKDDIWIPQELIHGLQAHALGDMVTGSSLSTRIEVNNEGTKQMGQLHRIGGAVLRGVAGNFFPEKLEAAVYVKGYSNEQSAEAVYKTIQNWLHSLGMPHVAEFFSQPIAEEAKHGMSYRDFLLELIEENPSLRDFTRKQIENDTAPVGDEIRSEQASARMLLIISTIDDGKIFVRGKRADNLFVKNLPWMKGVTPFQNRLTVR